MKAKLADRMLEALLRRYSNIEWSSTTAEYKVGKPGKFYKGSIWIRPRLSVYRVQTTGIAQGIDSFITTLIGEPEGSQKPNEYKFWSSVSASDLEKLIVEFDKRSL